MLALKEVLRGLRAAPVVSAIAVLSLALGIGATTAVFSILDAVLLRTLPVVSPERLALVSIGEDQTSLTNPQWEAIRARMDGIFTGAAVWGDARLDTAQGGESQLATSLYVNGAFFDTLGVRAQVGRTLVVDDDQRGGGRNGAVAVISDAFWRRQYGGADDVIGRTIMLQRVPFTIVGVSAAGFTGPSVGRSFDVAIPLGTEALINGENSSLDRRSSWWLTIAGRLPDGVSRDEAAAQLNAWRAQIRQETLPDDWRPEDLASYLDESFVLAPAAYGTSTLRRRYADPLKVMMGVVLLVLLIACANIANLLLARAMSRRRELGVRLALGASRARLAGQLLMESVTLAGLGAAGGLLVAHWGRAFLVQQLSTQVNTVFLDVSLDVRLLMFTGAVAMVTAMAAGTAPAWWVGRADAGEALLAQSRSASGDARRGVAGALVVGQVALSVVLIFGAGVFVRTFSALTALDLGFDRQSMLMARVNSQVSEVPAEALAEHYERMREAMLAVPGVTAVAASVVTPISGSSWQFRIEVPERPDLTPAQSGVYVNLIQPGWFDAYGTRLVAGRDFTTADRRGGDRVAIINETAARVLYGEASPIGRTIRQPARPGTPATTMTVIGVAHDAAYRTVRDAIPATMYLPLAQQDEPPVFMSFGIRTIGAFPLALSTQVTEAVGRVDGRASITFRALDEQVDSALMQERILAQLSGFFGGLALLLAGIGLYGVTTHAVNRRRLEMGIRMALGSSPGGVLRLVLQQVGSQVGTGILIGAVISYWAASFLSGLAWGVESRDPLTFATAGLVLLVVGGVAGWLPARRASHIDPARVLGADR